MQTSLQILYLLINMCVNFGTISAATKFGKQVIWYNQFWDTNENVDWVLHEAYFNVYADINCPNQERCHILAQGDNAYVYRIASTKNYQDIELVYSISGDLLDMFESCKISYNINNVSDNNWQEIVTWKNGDNAVVDRRYNFVNAADNQGVGIKLSIVHFQDLTRCYFNDFYLIGNYFTSTPTTGTFEPTNNPTSVPTTYTPTTYTPTTSLPTTITPTTVTPTTSIPTTSTPTTITPTNVPSLNPTDYEGEQQQVTEHT
eukprot:281519_1